jgi:hypothetical protein
MKPRQKMYPAFLTENWAGVRAGDNAMSNPGYLSAASNVYKSRTANEWLPRPGIYKLNSSSAGNITWQAFGQLTKLDGTEVSFAIGSGEIYTINWSTGALTKVVSQANLGADAPAITLSTSARCYTVQFNNKIIINDGANQPFSWDGGSGTSSTALLSNCNAVVYGKPVVHAGKLFFIDGTTRNKIIWSEELAENTGYESGSFTNFWILGQTDQEAIHALIAIEGVMYFFRPYSIGQITGTVTSNFSSDATLDGVSTTVGTAWPEGVTLYEGAEHALYVWLLDSEGRPWRFAAGSPTMEPLWKQRSGMLTGSASYQVIPFEGLDLVLYVNDPITGTADVFGANDGEYYGTWTQSAFSGMTAGGPFGLMKDTTFTPDRPVLVNGQTGGSNTHIAVYRYPGTYHDDTTTSYNYSITTALLGSGDDQEKLFDVAGLEYRVISAPSSVTTTVSTATRDATSFTNLTASPSLTGGSVDVMKTEYGVGSQGRELQHKIQVASYQSADAAVAFKSLFQTAAPTADGPGVR